MSIVCRQNVFRLDILHVALFGHGAAHGTHGGDSGKCGEGGFADLVAVTAGSQVVHVVGGFGSGKARVVEQAPEGMVGGGFGQVIGLHAGQPVHRHGPEGAGLEEERHGQGGHNRQEYEDGDVGEAGLGKMPGREMPKMS